MTRLQLLIGTTLLLIGGAAEAQLIGNRPYGFPARDNSTAAQAQMRQRHGPEMVINQYYSTSTSIGNMTSVTQQVGAGGSAGLTMNQTQTNSGNQGANASVGLTAIENLTSPAR